MFGLYQLTFLFFWCLIRATIEHFIGTRLNEGDRLEFDDYLESPSGYYRLLLENNGNLVGFDVSSGDIFWSTGTSGNYSGAIYLQLKYSNNLGLWNHWSPSDPPATLWETRTGRNNYDIVYLTIQDDRNIVLYAENGTIILWQSNTTVDDYVPQLEISFVDAGESGYWWKGETTCLNNYGTHLATLNNSLDLNYFKFSCKNLTCWTGYNNYYSENNEWFWLSYGQVNEDADLIFSNISGINASLSENENGCVVYDSSIEMFLIVDCDDESLNYQFICDSNQSFDQVGNNASSRYVTLPMKMNWFDAQSFCSRMYGTSLGSIRMKEENDMFISLNNELSPSENGSSSSTNDLINTYWIGYYNFGYDSKSLFEYHRTDFLSEISFGYYANWDDSIFNSEEDNELSGENCQNCKDCVYLDSSTETWFTDNCRNDDSHFIMCDNPYFFNYGYISSLDTIWNSKRFRLAPVIRKNRYTNMEDDENFNLENIAENMDQYFSEAQMACLLFYGTHLATVYNKEENDLIFSIINGDSDGYTFMNLDNIDSVMIGYYDFGEVEGSYRWDNSHSSSNYTNWATNQPNNGLGGTEDITLLTDGQGGDWHDYRRDARLVYGVCDSPYYELEEDNNDYNGDIFVERNISYVSIHTCESWNNVVNLKLPDTMHMVIGDFSGEISDYIIINKNRELPNPGYWDTFEINDTSLINMYDNGYDILKVSIGMASVDVDICIDGLILFINGESYVLNDQVSNGLILSSDCRLPFFYVEESDILIHCHEGLFTIYPSYGSTIVNQMIEVEIETCATDDASVNFTKIEDDLTINLIGKDSDSNVWVSTDTLSLNHVSMTGQVDWSKVGTLMVTDVQLCANGTSTIIPVNNDGILIGLKIVVSPQDNNWGKEDIFDFNSWGMAVWDCDDDPDCVSPSTSASLFRDHFSVDSMNTTWISTRAWDDDVTFEVSHDEYLSIYISSTTNAENVIGIDGVVQLSIYAIFLDKLENYGLPYQYVGLDSLTWWEAENYCLDNFNTHLASVHSFDENIALMILAKGGTVWLGLTNEQSLSEGFIWSDYTNFNYDNWQGDVINEYDQCGYLVIGHDYWSPIGCSVTTNDRYFVCNSRMWNSNTNKKFNIPVESTFSNGDDVVMVAITNNNDEDSICINSIIVNGLSAQSIPNRWIGDSNNNECENNDCVTTTYAMMKWPICSIEVTSVTLDWGNADILESESSLSGLTCKNYNRLRSTTCDIVNEYSFETSTTYEFAQEQTYSYSSTVSSTTGRAVSSESSTTFGGGFSSTSGTEFSIGVSATSTTTIGAEVEYDAGVTSASASVEKSFETSISAEQSQSSESTSESSWERTNNRISERYSEVSREKSYSSENTNSEIFGVSTSRTDSVSCVGSMDVPPSSSISYILSFAKITAIVPTYTDLKLTMCSAYLGNSDDDTSNDDSVKYIYDIEGTVGIDFASHCDVSFNSPSFLNNELSCSDEQKLAWLTEGTFVPVCNETDAQFYDGCQCNGLNFWGSPTSCMCVDLYGNPSSDGKMLIHENDDWRDTCRQLNCQHSIYNSSQLDESSSSSSTSSAAASASTSGDSNSNSGVDIAIIIIVILSVVLICIIFIICGVICGVKHGYVNLDKLKPDKQKRRPRRRSFQSRKHSILRKNSDKHVAQMEELVTVDASDNEDNDNDNDDDGIDIYSDDDSDNNNNNNNNNNDNQTTNDNYQLQLDEPKVANVKSVIIVQ